MVQLYQSSVSTVISSRNENDPLCDVVWLWLLIAQTYLTLESSTRAPHILASYNTPISANKERTRNDGASDVDFRQPQGQKAEQTPIERTTTRCADTFGPPLDALQDSSGWNSHLDISFHDNLSHDLIRTVPDGSISTQSGRCFYPQNVSKVG